MSVGEILIKKRLSPCWGSSWPKGPAALSSRIHVSFSSQRAFDLVGLILKKNIFLRVLCASAVNIGLLFLLSR